jgi:hypothetical protein
VGNAGLSSNTKKGHKKSLSLNIPGADDEGDDFFFKQDDLDDGPINAEELKDENKPTDDIVKL